MTKARIIYPTIEEDEAINRGIAEDPDTEELTGEWFARARPASEVAPELVADYARRRGAQKAGT
jgi:hypothetical protein